MTRLKNPSFLVFLGCLVALLGGCSPSPQPMRLMYWNIQNGMWDGQSDHYDRFVDYVRSKNPDVCVWAEAQTLWKTESTEGVTEQERYLPDGWEELARRYGHDHVFLSAHPDGYPQVVTSKYPISEVLRMDGKDSDTIVAHGASWSTIQVRNKTIHIVTLHTWPHAYAYRAQDREASIQANGGDIFRAKEMAYICRHTIQTRPQAAQELWMMMGDFNSRSRADNAFYRFPEHSTKLLVHDYILQNTPYVDIIHDRHPGEFITSTQGQARIDFVYLTPALSDMVREAVIARDYYTEPVKAQGLSNFYYPSDHRPIIVDFDLR